MTGISRTQALVALALGALVLAVAAAPRPAAAGQPTEADRAAAARGERSFRTYCASCHGKEAKGDGPLAKDLRAAPADLTQLAAKNEGQFPFERVTETINHGRTVRGHGTEDMPAWGDAFKMTSETEADAKSRMEELAHYLWTIQKK